MSYGELNRLHFAVDVLGRFLRRIRRVVALNSMVSQRVVSTTTFFPLGKHALPLSTSNKQQQSTNGNSGVEPFGCFIQKKKLKLDVKIFSFPHLQPFHTVRKAEGVVGC